jgi:3',5'-cyclic AMP phosphodiesterase CpdA
LFRDQELAVLGLDTARRFTHKNGRVSSEQIAEIDRVFRDVPTQVFKVLATHHPLAIPHGEIPVRLAGRSRSALDTIINSGVRLLLSGHHHRAVSGNMTELGGHGSILVVHAGTAISTRVRNSHGNTYNLMQVEAGRVFVRVMAWTKGAGFQEQREMAYAFRKDGWERD